jgi:hypothetical protein
MMLRDMFVGAKKPDVPKPPKIADPAAQKKADEAQARAMYAKGRSSTVLTGGGLGHVG